MHARPRPARTQRTRVRAWLSGWTARLVLLATFVLCALAPARAVRNNENESKQEERNEAEEELEATHAIAQRRSAHRTARSSWVIGTLASARAPRTIAPTMAPPDVRPPFALPRRSAPPGDDADLG